MNDYVLSAEDSLLITGAHGFLGTHVQDAFRSRGYKNFVLTSSKTDDLRVWENCKRVVKGVHTVVHMAAHVGGIGLNRDKPGELFYDNAIMGIQLMEAARQEGVQKFVTLGTICAYPKFTPVPFKEDDLWNGYPEETNAPYGIAKKALLVQGQAYRQQYGMNCIFLLPVNLYGPGDNFKPESSHVIPALIKKVQDAIDGKTPHLEAWGTGVASREFLFAKDAAEGIVSAVERYDSPEPVNIGAGFEITIRELTELICKLMGYTGEIRWDSTKPDGQPRRMLDISRAKEEFGFVAKTPFETGLAQTIAWYRENRSQ
jgi:GDP-L-fucose synthase